MKIDRVRALWMAVALGLLWSVGGCRGEPKIAPAPSGSVAAVAQAQNDFGFRLLRTLFSYQPSQNAIISPLSLSQALTMTYNGAGGGTKGAMAEVLRIASIDTNTVSEANHQLLRLMDQSTGHRGLFTQLLERWRRRKAWVAIANALWIQKGLAVNPILLCNTRKFDPRSDRPSVVRRKCFVPPPVEYA